MTTIFNPFSEAEFKQLTRNAASMKKLKGKPEWLRAGHVALESLAEGVDRKANVLRGMVMALEGPFKSHGRGEFDEDGLRGIVKLANSKPKGLRSNFTHESVSGDSLGKHLGRVKNARMSTAIAERDDKRVTVKAARGDLYFDQTALDTPPEGGKPLGIYVMELAESDPDAISSSLVIQPELLYRRDEKGKVLMDEEGNELPPLWIPKKLFGSDIVAVGDAVDGLLSAGIDVDGLPDAVVRRGKELLDKQFEGADRETIKARCLSWLERYLDLKFGEEVHGTPLLDEFRAKMKALAT